jgi:hypothetical protein
MIPFNPAFDNLAGKNKFSGRGVGMLPLVRGECATTLLFREFVRE